MICPSFANAYMPFRLPGQVTRLLHRSTYITLSVFLDKRCLRVGKGQFRSPISHPVNEDKQIAPLTELSQLTTSAPVKCFGISRG
jgi:hypothetical protein